MLNPAYRLYSFVCILFINLCYKHTSMDNGIKTDDDEQMHGEKEQWTGRTEIWNQNLFFHSLNKEI